MIHAAQTAKRPGGIEKRLGKRCFSRVHMRENADAQRGLFRIQIIRHTVLPFLRFGTSYYITKGTILQ